MSADEMRTWADPEAGGEAYIPLDVRGEAAQRILQAVRERLKEGDGWLCDRAWATQESEDSIAADHGCVLDQGHDGLHKCFCGDEA